MQKADINTKVELLNNALSLFEWAVKQKEAGRMIVSVSGDSGKELIIPVLERVRRTE